VLALMVIAVFPRSYSPASSFVVSLAIPNTINN
jgi:hypothetical protein